MAEISTRESVSPVPTCCSGFYEQDWVRILTEGSFHPGGMDLTRRCVAALELPPGARLLDVGCGAGTTAFTLAAEAGLDVTGIDPSSSNVCRANALADRLEAGRPRPRFLEADAGQLPFEDRFFHGVLAECVVSLLPDPVRALQEIRRVLAPNGALALTDMAIEGELPADLVEVVAPWTCLLGARSESGWKEMIGEAGYDISGAHDESQGLTRLLGDLKRRLLAAGAATLLSDRVDGAPELPLQELRHWLRRFEEAVAEGRIRYLRFQLAPGRPK